MVPLLSLKSRKRAQVGIGTLIIFISMVLIAAIASGVLINSAGFLHTKAKTTGQEAQGQVSDRIQVVSKTGNIGQGGSDTITVFNKSEIYVEGSKDHRETISDGGTLYLYDDDDESGTRLVVEGSESPMYSGTMSDPVKYTFKHTTGNKIKVTDESNNVVVTEGEAPLGVWTSAGVFNAEELKFNPSNNFGPGYDSANEVYIDYENESPPNANISFPKEQETRYTKQAVTNFTVGVMKAPGSETVALKNVTVTYHSSNTTTVLLYGAGKPAADNFSVTALKRSEPVLVETGDQALLKFNASAIEEGRNGLYEGESVNLIITTQEGTKTTMILQVPKTLAGESHVPL